jgi:cobalt-zinc-cadmium efflux system outer membrane protein
MKNMLAACLGLGLVAACGGPPFARVPLPFEPSRFYPPPPDGTAPERAAEKLLAKQTLTLEEVLFLADMYNPDLQSARLEPEVKAAESWDAGLFPNPVLEFEVEDAPASGGGLSGSKRVAGIRQDVPLFGRVGAARRLKEAEREAARERVREARRRILTRTKVSFYSCLAASRRSELLAESARIADELHAMVKEKFANRAVPEADFLKASIERALTRQDLNGAARDLAARRRALAALVGLPELPFERLSGDLREQFESVSEDTLQDEVFSTHPALGAARKDLLAAELEIELARAQAWPDLGVGVRGGRGEEGDSIVEFGIEIPLPLFNRNQARIHAAELRAAQARRAVESIRHGLHASLVRAHVDFLNAQERAASYRSEILPIAEKALRQSDEGYRAGATSFLNVLDAQRTLAETRMAYQAVLLDLQAAVAAIEELIGRPLEAAK